ncbi:hypothetical protein, partial [Acidithiobacillus ferriphilus]|uniref:hypothetical protein n=1 Tax=Acidithiobacillus ferriphilus TaxID=1689834 RepID=UPI002DB591D7
MFLNPCGEYKVLTRVGTHSGTGICRKSQRVATKFAKKPIAFPEKTETRRCIEFPEKPPPQVLVRCQSSLPCAIRANIAL